jgi:hypothetical protein
MADKKAFKILGVSGADAKKLEELGKVYKQVKGKGPIADSALDEMEKIAKKYVKADRTEALLRETGMI